MASPLNEGASVLAPPERNSFFFGKLMDVQQWRKDQRHFDLKRSLVNRLVLGSGVVCGLALEAADEGLVRLLPGMALDRWGREIVVPTPKEFDPRQPTDEEGQPQGPTLQSGSVSVCLAYHETCLDAVPALVPDCDHPGGCAPDTVREEYRLLIREVAGDPPPPPACGFADLPWADPAKRYRDLRERITDSCADAPAESCIEIARIMVDDGAIDTAGRPIVYGNALLLELLLCLADHVFGQP
jgi:hypothetical protein